LETRHIGTAVGQITTRESISITRAYIHFQAKQTRQIMQDPNVHFYFHSKTAFIKKILITSIQLHTW